MSGQISAAPRRRNTDAQKADLKEGRIPDAWAAKPSRLARKHRDARWTLRWAKARPAKADGTKAKVEIAIPMFGDMSHVSIDCKHGFIRRFAVSSAAARDGAQLANVLDATNTASDVRADTAYRSKTNEAHLAKHGRRSRIHFRRQPGRGLAPSQPRPLPDCQNARTPERQNASSIMPKLPAASNRRLTPPNGAVLRGVQSQRFLISRQSLETVSAGYAATRSRRWAVKGLSRCRTAGAVGRRAARHRGRCPFQPSCGQG